jgi:hypothetical protein
LIILIPSIVNPTTPASVIDKGGGYIENVFTLTAGQLVSIAIKSLDDQANNDTTTGGYFIVHKIM